MNNERIEGIKSAIDRLNKVKDEMSEEDKGKVESAGALHEIIDDLSKIIEKYRTRGCIPTFSVRYGVIGMVAVYPRKTTRKSGVRTRQRKNASATDAELAMQENLGE